MNRLADPPRPGVYRWTSLGRPFDRHSRRTLFVLAFAAAAAVLGGLISLAAGRQAGDSLSAALMGAFTVLAAGALAVELAPGYVYAAVPAAALALPAVSWAGASAVLPLVWLYGILRLVSRASGLPARLTDCLLLLALSGWLTWNRSLLYGAIAAVAFFLDAALPQAPRRRALFGLAAAALTLLYAVAADPPLAAGDPARPVVVAALLAVTILFIPVILSGHNLAVPAEATGAARFPLRTQASQALALGVGLVFASWGRPGVVTFLPLWAALLGVSLYHLLARRLTGPAAQL